jgi:signal transduction histidine kinase
MAGYLVAAIGGYSSPPLGFLWWAASAWLQGAGWLCFDHGNPDPTSPTHRESSRSLIDGAISALSLFLLMWATFLRERLDGSDLPLAWKASLLLLFLSAAGVLGVLAHALAKGSRVWQGPAGASAAAFLAMGFLAPLWLESRAFLLPVWFGLFLTTRLSWPLPSVGEERAGLPIQDLLPFLPALVAFLAVLAHDFRAHPGTNSVGLGLFVGVALLVTARQFLTLRDLRDLNQELEERVQVRTRDLAGSQSLMLKTQRMNLVASLGAGLVHDVNHLVEAGIDYADQLGGDLKKGVAPRVEDLESVETALARANSLTSQLMGFAREKEAVTEVMDVTDQLQNLGPLLRILVPKGIALAVEPHFEPVLIRSNPSQFDQVIVNLVSNAKDATPPGGMVRINCWVSGPPDSAEAAIEVSDTGFGMSPEMIEKVFDPFFTTKSPGKGTGLGLSSVKSVIEGVQGRIEIDSEPGVGTVCRLFIPLVEERVGLSRPIP